MSAGLIAVSVSACISLASVLALLAALAWRRRTSSQFTVLLVNLCISDLIQALGFALTARGGIAVIGSPTAVCTVQAVLIQIGDTSSALWTLAIAVHSIVVLGLHRRPSNFSVGFTVVGNWLFVAFLASFGPLANRNSSRPFYDSTGPWCWIGAGYEYERFTLHYALLLVTSLVLIIAYPALAWQLRGNAATDAVAMRMLAYPPAYLALILPISVTRIAGIAGIQSSEALLCAVGSVFTLSGAVNGLVFLSTRRGLLAHQPVVKPLSGNVSSFHVDFEAAMPKTAAAYHHAEAAAGRPSTAASNWFEQQLEKAEFQPRRVPPRLTLRLPVFEPLDDEAAKRVAAI